MIHAAEVQPAHTSEHTPKPEQRQNRTRHPTQSARTNLPIRDHDVELQVLVVILATAELEEALEELLGIQHGIDG
jgi:hypothetical protein